MGLNANQLPKHVRERLGIPGASRTRERTTRRGDGTTGGAWTCPRCPDVGPFTRWADAARHQTETGHRRLACVIGGVS